MGGGSGGSLPNSNQSVGGVLSCQGTGSGNGGYLRCNAVAVAGADGNLTGFSDVILEAAVQCPAGQLAVGGTSESISAFSVLWDMNSNRCLHACCRYRQLCGSTGMGTTVQTSGCQFEATANITLQAAVGPGATNATAMCFPDRYISANGSSQAGRGTSG